jgi:hypothetical protein
MQLRAKSLLVDLAPPAALRVYRHYKYAMMRDANIARNAALRNLYRGRQRCFVIGNGPSLRKYDLSCLRNEIVFVANYFNLHPQCRDVSPRYYCFDDPNAFFTGTFGDQLEGDRSAWFEDVCLKAPEAQFLVPLEAKGVIESNKWFAGRQIWYVARRQPSVELGFAESDLTRYIAHGQGTLAALAIPAAIYMGLSTIYLLGCDANWWVANLAREDLDAEHQHFYDRNPFVASRESNLRDFGLERELRDLSDHFKSLRLLREHAHDLGVKIVNASGGGILDVFPTADLTSVLGPACVLPGSR